MTKFEQVAINLQNQAYRKDWAVKQFEQSCYICCLRGRRCNCDQCIIASVHKMTIAALDENKGGEK